MFKKMIFSGLLVSSFVSAYALSPTLVATPSGDNNNVNVSVTGDANTSVVFFYKSALTSGSQSANLGNTDASGSYKGTVSTTALGIDSSVPVYVLLNGYMSSTVVWPYTAATSTVNTSISASQSNISLTTGQTSSVTLTGTGSYFISNNTNSSVASGIISGSNLTITASSSGTAIMTVCQNSSQCTNVTVTVTPVVSSTPNTFSPIITVGQVLNLSVSGNSLPYYLSSANNGTFLASVLGNNLSITGSAVGSNSVNVCASNGTCTPLSVTVIAAPTTTPASVTEPVATTPENHKFYTPLKYGDTNDEVIEVQKRLKSEGYFSGSFSKHFGSATLVAIKSYQKDHGLAQLGNLGPATRALLNK